ncbi:MAG: hypothetical protein Tsb0027_20560 [Wenzhouxiangellaceae bacterium]
MAKVNPGKSVSSIIMLVLLLAVAWQQQWLPHAPPTDSATGHDGDAGPSGNAAILRAFAEQRSNVQVRGEGTVQRVLPPDNDGNPHQRFIVQIEPGHTVLVAHNLTLAPAIDRLARGDRVAFYGEYEWNPRGGVIHWTHDDPQGRHADGWVEHAGRRYQ